MSGRTVRIARRETFPGEFSNVEVEVEVEARPEERTQDALERAAQEVASRLEFEKRRRRVRGPFWSDVTISSPSLESFDTGGIS